MLCVFLPRNVASVLVHGLEQRLLPTPGSRATKGWGLSSEKPNMWGWIQTEICVEPVIKSHEDVPWDFLGPKEKKSPRVTLTSYSRLTEPVGR